MTRAAAGIFADLPIRQFLTVLLIAIASVVVVSGCSIRPWAPYGEQGTDVREPESELHTVISGDTLYSIAWDSGRDYRDLAKWNRIPPPYLIKPGQQLRLYAPREEESPSESADQYYEVARGDTLFGIARSTGVSVGELAEWNRIPPPYAIRTGQRLRISPPGESGGKERSAKKKPSTSESGRADPSSKPSPRNTRYGSNFGPWSWPTEGRVLERFSQSNGSKGIDISGNEGQKIVAAASGVVVYQGSGLRGYGKLIIIKHDADFLSAYAHCAKIHVREGSAIKRGQKVAEMGNSGTDRVKLHFEIRYRGVPVDPLEYLPKR